MLELRPYQRQSVDALFQFFQHYEGNPLIVLPTGTGKSLVLSQFCREAIEQYPSTRIVVATHVKELVQQDYLEFVELWPFANAGVYSAGLNRRDTHHQVLFVGIQSIYNKAFQVQRCDLLIVDEGHTIPDSGMGMWRQFIADLKVINPYLKIIGLTATDYRMNSGSLVDGDDRIFTDVAYEYPILKAFQEGYLCEVIPKRMETVWDISGVAKAGGEFKASELENAVNVDAKTRAAIEEILQYGTARKSWLIFSSGNEHARSIHAVLQAHGIVGACVTQDTDRSERDTAVRGIKNGSLRYVVNNRIFTTGFNAKNIDLIADLGFTNSQGLHVQKLGRGTRPLYAPGHDLSTAESRLAAIAAGPKPNCLLLDFARNTDRHGPLDQIRARTKGKGSGDAPVKTCDHCHAVCFAGVRVCPDCGQPFPDPELKISATASAAAVISTQIEPEWTDVIGMTVRKHQKEGKPPSMRVSYHTVTKGSVNEYICFEHSGYAQQKAVAWHKARRPDIAPATIDEASLLEYPQPARIAVLPDGKWWRIVQYDFAARDDGPALAAQDVPLSNPPNNSGAAWGVFIDEEEIPF